MNETKVRSVHNAIERVLATREGGEVRRCHTRRVVHEQTVAQHQYNALSLLLLLYPGEPSTELVKAVLWHDVGERWTGDVYGPFKSRHPELGREIERAAEAWLDGYALSHLHDLEVEDRSWLEAVDLLEFYLWALEERALGNTTLERDTKAAREKLIWTPWWPKEVREFTEHYEFHTLEY